MKAIGFYKPGDAGVLQWLDMPEPQLRERDILVRVEAVSVNPADCQSRAKTKPKDGAPHPGLRRSGNRRRGWSEGIAVQSW